MAGRIRSIKPEWLEDERLTGCSAFARVLSVGLILLADDYGNGRAGLQGLAGRVALPPSKVASALRELEKIRFVELYEIDGQSYYSIRNWARHQRVDKPGAALVPGPNGEARASSRARGGSDENQQVSSEVSRHSRDTVAAVSRQCPDTVAPDLDLDLDQDREPDLRASARDPSHGGDGGSDPAGPGPDAPASAATESALGDALPVPDGPTHEPQPKEPVIAKPAASADPGPATLSQAWVLALRLSPLTAFLADDDRSVQLLASKSFDLKLKPDRVSDAVSWAVDRLETKSAAAAGGSPLNTETTLSMLVSGIRGEITKRQKAVARGEHYPRDAPVRVDAFTPDQRRTAAARAVEDSKRQLADMKAGKGFKGW